MTSISFFSEDIDFELINENSCISWLENAIKNEDKIAGELSFVFCDDEYLHKINIEYLNHDTYTDIITFDYTEANIIAGDIFISIDRVKENAKTFNTLFENELSRVIIHGVLHLMGYKDKTQEESTLMRAKEDFYLNLHP
jgi:rRNA maturation RNase YbeY